MYFYEFLEGFWKENNKLEFGVIWIRDRFWDISENNVKIAQQ